MMFEDKIDYWHLADELTVEQATLSMLNANPSTPEAVDHVCQLNDFGTIAGSNISAQMIQPNRNYLIIR